MPRKPIQQYKNIVCHLYNRGVNKDKIFREEEDYLFYLKRIKKYKELHKIEFISYALLPNHFHFIVRQLTDGFSAAYQGSVPFGGGQTPISGTDPLQRGQSPISGTDPLQRGQTPIAGTVPLQRGQSPDSSDFVRLDGTISKFMHDLHSSYSCYFNKRYERVGHLFQDRYKQKVVEDEKYLIWLAGYVNGNPMIHKVVDDPKDWQYSSYLDFIGERNGTICNKESVLAYFKLGTKSGTVPFEGGQSPISQSPILSANPFAAHVKEVSEMCKKRKEDLKDLEFGLGM